MKVVILDEADAELAAAAEWYEREKDGLGDELLVEAARVIRAIAEGPKTWPLVARSRTVRRLVFTRFPYIAYFVISTEEVRVIAFGHTSRKPGYWRQRLKR